MTIQEAVGRIHPADTCAYKEAKARWNAIAKPLGGLGRLEEAVCRIAAAAGTANVNIEKRVVAVFCADNGVVEEGISQSGCEVTGAVVGNLCRGVTSVSRMAARGGCEVLAVDMGIRARLEDSRLLDCRIASGTANMARGPAMTREQAIRAVEAGIAVAGRCADTGFRLLAAGEIGMGNTTTTTAVTSVLLHLPPEAVAGKGAGLSREGIKKKAQVVRAAIALNEPDARDPLDVLAKVGGFDIAAMCGFYLGAAAHNLPVVLDGAISGAAAVCAARLCPRAGEYFLASHVSTEPAARLLLAELDLSPVLHAGLHLGEGTGAVALMPLLDMALAVYHTGATFTGSRIDAYLPLEK